jgi:hypothetical protein
MSEDLPYIVPGTSSEVEAAFSSYQTSHQFYQEVQIRTDFQAYCEWYNTTAQNNRQDLQKMRGELNIFRWFRRS